MTDPQEAAITAATEAWRGRLSSLADPIEFLEHVEASQLAAGLTYKGSAVMPVAEPVFLTESEHEGDRRAVDAALAALVAAGERVFADPVLRPRFLGDFSGDGVSSELVNLPTGYDLPIVFGRLDGMRVGTGLQFLEFNGGLPGGVTPTDLSAELMASWGVAQDFRDSIPFRTMTTAPAVMDALVATWHSYGGSGRPYTVLALPHELEEIATPQWPTCAGPPRPRTSNSPSRTRRICTTPGLACAAVTGRWTSSCVASSPPWSTTSPPDSMASSPRCVPGMSAW